MSSGNDTGKDAHATPGKVNIMVFRDRVHAAQCLADKLQGYRSRRPLVLGIPRGGVVLAAVMAKGLEGDVDVVLVHKLRHPLSPEIAVGAVDESGQVTLNDPSDMGGVSAAYIDAETRLQRNEIETRRRTYTPVRPPVDPHGRTVIVVDDGLATGATMTAALRSLRRRGADRIVAAVPIAPRETLYGIQALADEVVCLKAPRVFSAVSQGYRDFEQVEDDEVIRLLADRPGRESAPALPAAVVFDFDGVIADTEPLHYEAFQYVLRPEGMTYSWEEYLAHYVGFDDRDAFRFGFRSAGKPLTDKQLAAFIEEKERVFERLVRGGSLSPYPGVSDLLGALDGAGVPVALCTGARARDIAASLVSLRLEDAFAVTVTAEDVAASKPDPESYARSVTALKEKFRVRGFVSEHCVAIEDTPAGIASAKAAGLRAVGVTNTHDAEALAQADRVVGELSGVTPSALGMLTEGREEV